MTTKIQYPVDEQILRHPRRRWVLPILTAVAALILGSCSSEHNHSSKNHTAQSASSTTTSGAAAGSIPSSSALLAPPVTVTASATERSSAQQTVRQLLNALVHQDWNTLYDLSASSIQQGESEKVFASSMSAQPRILSARLAGAGQESVHVGVKYWSQGVVLATEKPGGGQATYTATTELIQQKGQWRMIGTSKPVSAP